jgi:hypothetical protein
MSLPARAAGGCELTLAPNEIEAESVTNVQFTITNTGDEPINWMQVSRPDTNAAVMGISVTDWTDVTTADGSTLSDGVVAPGDSMSFQLGIQTNDQTGGAIWNFIASSSGDSSNAFNCNGDTTITTVNDDPGGGGSDITGIAATNLKPTEATIVWHTVAISGSVVYYGKTTSYGRASAYNSNMVNNHSVTLTGLEPNTTYHFRVSGNDSGGATHASDDNTFKTPALPVVTSSGSGSSLPPPVVAVNAPPVPGDTTPPTISLATSFTKPFTSAPNITGTARDNGILAHIEYSIDGGQNWSPVTEASGLGGKEANFGFTPVVQDDGNFGIIARAFDSNGNEGRTGVSTLVIDRLPPQAGPLVVSYGPESLTLDNQGVLNLVAGTEYNIVTSAIGGPISLVIEAGLSNSTGKASKSFTLSQSPESGLWNGSLSFTAGGTYTLQARSLDGAGNLTNRPLLTAVVSPAGKVLGNNTKQPVAGSQVTLYYLEPASRSWGVWDGAPYGQTNPQPTKTDGSYSLMLPSGTYYLKVTAPGHYAFVSNIFEMNRARGLTSVISLGPKPHTKIGGLTLELPDIGWRSQPLLTGEFKLAGTKSPLIGTLLPDFALPTTTGGQKRALDLLARPTVISVLATWSPASQAQLAALTRAQTNTDVNVVPLFSQERAQLVSVYLATAGYSLNAVVDADGVLVPKLGLSTVPQHIFVDRTGHVKKVMVGVLSKDELLTQLGGL